MRFPYLEKHPKLRVLLEWSLKLTIFAFLFAAIYKQVFLNKDIGATTAALKLAIKENKGTLLLVLLLMPINWLLETFKWQLLIKKVEVLSLPKAFAAILAGVTFTMFTPNRMGEYGGRFLFLKEPMKAKALQATVLGSLAQIICTIIFGMLAITYMVMAMGEGMILPALTLFAIIFTAFVLLFFYFRSNTIYTLLPDKGWIGKMRAKLALLEQFEQGILSGVLLLAGVRYVVYALQYLLLLSVLSSVTFLSMKGLAQVSLAFLLQTAIPTIALFDMGIRGNVALFLFKNTQVNAAGIVAAAFSLWFINLLIPAVMGYAIILWKRWFKLSEPRLNGLRD
jgi:hypothetical protein